MLRNDLPLRQEMLDAFASRDSEYEGVFITAVRTTGIFCRPTCPAKRPREENVEFFLTAREALSAGYRPCRRCRPLEPLGEPPVWLRPLLEAVEAAPLRRWTDQDLRDRDLQPERIRRWFKKTHGMTFHAYCRSRRLGEALGRIRHGESVTRAAFESGYESLSGFNEAVRQLLQSPPRKAASAGEAVFTVRINGPLGPMIACATDDKLCLLEFADRRMLEAQLNRMSNRLAAVLHPGQNEVLKRTEEQLVRYFDGSLSAFDLPLGQVGSEFQQRVWDRLVEIPYGQTCSYGDVAEELSTHARAVARAVGSNALAIVVPCHRVVGSDGRLTGYGGGLWRKRRLLEHESVELPLFRSGRRV